MLTAFLILNSAVVLAGLFIAYHRGHGDGRTDAIAECDRMLVEMLDRLGIDHESSAR